MLTIIICALLCSIIGYIWVSLGEEDWAVGTAGAFMGTLVGLIIGALIAACIDPPYSIHVKTNKVVTLQDNSSLEGRFYLFGGVIDGDMKYTYYVQNGDEYKMLMTDYDKAVIQTTNQQPVSQHYIAKREHSLWSIGGSKEIEVFVVFRVPAGTIGNEYTLDAK